MKSNMSLEDCFFGAATVGDRGQVVIPSEARRRFNISPGDKLLVMAHPHGGVVLCKLEAMREIFSSFMESLAKIESEAVEPGEAREGS